MIPKIIHYCWFGRGEKSELIKQCMRSWKKYCPEYKIIEWNEDNFDININQFAKEAYEQKMYAFVSDYIRLYALYNYGGVYLDTDVEIRQNINKFLKNKVFTSFESNNYISTAIMGAEKGNQYIKRLLQYYNHKGFNLDNGTQDVLPNTKIITEITHNEYGLVLNNKEQILQNEVRIYPDYVFCNNVNLLESYAVHHFNGSWKKEKDLEQVDKQRIKYKKNYSILIELLKRINNKEQLSLSLQEYRDIYIFGTGYISEYLIDYLKDSGYQLKGIVVRELSTYKVNHKKKLTLYNFDQPSEGDLIIVTPSYAFYEICDEMTSKTKANIVSVEFVLGLRIMPW